LKLNSLPSLQDLVVDPLSDMDLRERRLFVQKCSSLFDKLTGRTGADTVEIERIEVAMRETSMSQNRTDHFEHEVEFHFMLIREADESGGDCISFDQFCMLMHR
jgi:hypothetical protein